MMIFGTPQALLLVFPASSGDDPKGGPGQPAQLPHTCTMSSAPSPGSRTAGLVLPLPPATGTSQHPHNAMTSVLSTMAGPATCSPVLLPPPPSRGRGHAGARRGEDGAAKGDGGWPREDALRRERGRRAAQGQLGRPPGRHVEGKGACAGGMAGRLGRGAAGPGARWRGRGGGAWLRGPPLPSPVGPSPGGAAPRQGAGSTRGAGLARRPSPQPPPGRASAASRLRPQPPPSPPPPWPPLSPAALWEADLTRCCRRPAGSGTRRHGGRDRR